MTVLDRPVQAPESAGAVRAVLALARVEARRLLLHPMVAIALAGYLLWPLWSGSWRDTHQVLQEVDRESQLGPLLVGLAGLLAANSAVLRSLRHGTEAHFGVLVMPPWRRTVAHALSVLPLTLVVAAAVAGMFAWEATRPGAVGHASGFELATGPLMVLFFGVLGVLLGRLVPSMFAGATAVVAILAVTFVFAVLPDGVRWLVPLVADEGAAPLPSDLVGRPARWHALYLVGLTVLAGAVAALASGGRTAAVRATALGALGVTVAGTVMQVTGPSAALVEARERATRDPASVQECLRRGTTTYCAFPEFVPWVDEWRVVVDGVRSLAGEPAASRGLVVRQRVNALDGPSGGGPSGIVEELPPGPRGEVTVSTVWGDEGRLGLAVSVARGMVVDDENHGVYCDARGVLMMWMAVNGAPGGRAAFARTQTSTLWSPLLEIRLRDRENAVVRALLERPAAEVARQVKASWAELVRPDASTDRVAALLGVTAPAETAADREWRCA
ncbi:hypothetical protein SAMN04489712_11064 [Thermomonospora echinospora]|uniref:Uncharacterized protein n=1 Tax=Thermomonospora echinospora TaxID=1992 RepID=A0A1H6CJD7_9ACTN|nr:ABC transporter permease [Thermomonospora echinospora]SEG73040.1 hypothetical protein SAMN04489712_11064 [Thermomonospora echinospora]